MDSIKNIKATIVLPKNSKDQEYDQAELFYVPGAWGNGGSTVKILWSEIIADPVGAIKKDRRAARLTNANAEQVEFITKTPLSELKKLQKSDGKEVSRSRGTGREAVHSNQED